jgi:hypothetical protein
LISFVAGTSIITAVAATIAVAIVTTVTTAATIAITVSKAVTVTIAIAMTVAIMEWSANTIAETSFLMLPCAKKEIQVLVVDGGCVFLQVVTEDLESVRILGEQMVDVDDEIHSY